MRLFFLKLLFCNKFFDIKKIKIAKNVFLAKTSNLCIKFGGSIKIGSNTELLDGVLIYTYGGNIEIGSNCSINPYTIIYGHGNVKIGNKVLIAGHCMIIPNNHNFNDITISIYDQGNTSKGIVIEDDVWIGHSCSILDGVTIGKGAVIAAGSVVNRNIQSYSVYGGVPAHFIKKR